MATSISVTWLTILAIYLMHSEGIADNTLTIGYILPWERGWIVGQTVGSSIILGIEEVQRRQLLPGYEIQWLMRDTFCEPMRGIQVMTHTWHMR